VKIVFSFAPLRLCVFALNSNCIVTTKERAWWHGAHRVAVQAGYSIAAIVAVFSAEKFIEIQPRIKSAMHRQGEFNEVIDGWQIRLFWEDGHRVLLAEAMYQR
jgi:hypothetical protein